MISGRTKLIVVLADPVEHIRAPTLLNGMLAARAMDAVVIPYHVRPEGLGRAWSGLRALENCIGGIATMPHKEALLELLDDALPEARDVGAVNVFCRAGSRFIGSNFDGQGFMDGLLEAGGWTPGRSAFIAGAGGAGAAIAFALAQAGARSLTLWNRTPARAEALAARVRSKHPACEVRATPRVELSNQDLVVNATSAGRDPRGPLPFPLDGLMPSTVCAEILMQDAPTAFLAHAAQRGCKRVLGEPMLAHQLERMIAFWAGQP